MKTKRQLAAILFADIVGYTALMQKDEQTASTLLRHFQQQLEEKVSTFNGRIVNFYGDGALCTFQIPLDAVRCAMALQTTFREAPNTPVRIGIHSGTVTLEGDKIFGDSVNITSRIESMGIAGGILISKKVRDEVKNNPDLKMTALGSFEFKNVEEPMEVFAIANKGFIVPNANELKEKFKTTTTPSSPKWLSIAAGIFALLVAGYFLWQQQSGTNQSITKESAKEKSSIAKKTSIALLQFEDGSPDKSLAYLGFGLKEELLTSLIKLQKLDIVSSSLIKAAQTKMDDPQLIGENLQADYVLGGSVLANENTIRFNVRLLDVANQQFIWAHNEESPRSELLQLQQRFAVAITKNLPIQATKTDLEKIQGIDIDSKAYELYLKGVYALNYVPEEAQNSSKYLLESIALEHDFAPPYVQLGINEWVLAEFGTAPPIPHWIQALKYINKAIALDSLNANAWGNKAVIQHNYEWDYEGAEQSLKMSESINPKAVSHYAVFLSNNGRKTELLEKIDILKANFDVKTNPDLYLLIGWLYINNDELDATSAIIKKLGAVKDMPTNWSYNQIHGWYYLLKKDYEPAIHFLKESIRHAQSNLEAHRLLALAYAKNKQVDKARGILNQLLELKKSRYVAPYHIAVTYIALGDLDKAFEEFNRAYKEHDFHLRWIWQEAVFYDPVIQNDPRYRDLLNKMELGHLPPRTPESLKN